jgi:predicted RNA methylase
MGQLADVLIAEIVDTGLLGENIIAATSDARRLLCKADVIIIPDGAAAYAGSIKSEEITRERSVDAANGFDISLFNNLRPNM